MKKITKRFIKVCIALIVILPLVGCYTGAITDKEPSGARVPIIVPPEIQTTGGGTPVALLFQYLSEPLLAPQTLALHERSDRTLEETAVRALIDGPSVARSDLSGLFASGVALLEARIQNDELSLTFNSTFTEPPTDMNLPADWEDNTEWVERVALRRRLATYSIVNTVTQMGRVKRVLFYVDESGDGTIERVRSRHLGLGDALSEAVQRDARYIATPQTVAEIALACVRERDFMRLERYIADKGISGETRPVREDMVNALSQLPQLIDFSPSDSMTFISYDGVSVVLDYDIITAAEDGKLLETRGMPFRLVREREKEIWKVPYEELEKLLK